LKFGVVLAIARDKSRVFECSKEGFIWDVS